MKFVMDDDTDRITLDFSKAGDFDEPVLGKIFKWYKLKPGLEDIDIELQPLIKDMWAHGYRTFNSCSGHGKRRGFIAFRPPGKRRLRGAVWEAEGPIPTGISQLNNVRCINIIIKPKEETE